MEACTEAETAKGNSVEMRGTKRLNKPRSLILAPSNLGLKPLHSGHVPGCWRAPELLCELGLAEALNAASIHQLARPHYDDESAAKTGTRNGQKLREFNLALAEIVLQTASSGYFPIVVGGDCSILLGALAGYCRKEPLSLIHIDGHSDFRHPGNFDFDSEGGTAAGMDLALVTGRGEALLTRWPGCPLPLVPDERCVQIGERESWDADFAWPDIWQTDIHRFDIFDLLSRNGDQIAALALERLDPYGVPFWLHVDLDVLDQQVLPAVDCPGSPGLNFSQLGDALRRLVHRPACAGVTLTIYDPDLDPELNYGRQIVKMMADVFGV